MVPQRRRRPAGAATFRLADENGVPPLVLGGLGVGMNVAVFVAIAVVLVATVVGLLLAG
jgi:hypothetical protein